MMAGFGSVRRSLRTTSASASTISALPSITSRSARRTGTIVNGSNEAFNAKHRTRRLQGEKSDVGKRGKPGGVEAYVANHRISSVTQLRGSGKGRAPHPLLLDQRLNPLGDRLTKPLTPGDDEDGVVAGDRADHFGPARLIQRLGDGPSRTAGSLEYQERADAVHAHQQRRQYLRQIRPDRRPVRMGVERPALG